MWPSRDINIQSLPHPLTKLVAITCLALSVWLISPPTARAQAPSDSDDAYDLSISPPVTYLQVEPGKTVTHALTIENKGQQTLMVSPKIIDFQASDSGAGLDLQAENSFPYLASQTKAVLQETFALNPGQKYRLNLVLSPPLEAQEKEYHLTVLFAAAPVDYPRLEAGPRISGAIGSNLIVFVSPQQTNKGRLKLKEVKAPPLIDSLSALTFQVLAENVGSQATTASGSAHVLNWQKKTVAEFKFFPDMVLANSLRSLRPSLPATGSANPAFEPSGESTFRYKPLFLIGPYTIEVTFQSATTQEPLVFRVLALPFSLMLIVVLAPVLYFLAMYITKLTLASK